ncbi:MAG: glycine oxidase ThiO [Pirellulaceae bacterium]
MNDCLVIGGGVVGLSLAYQLAVDGLRVAVVDRGAVGREASWAGAGILPPANSATAEHPYEQLCGLSHALHATWAKRLREETGIDTGFRRCGGIYVAQSAAEMAGLLGAEAAWRDEQIRCERCDLNKLGQLEPGLADAARAGRLRAAWLLPDEYQLRNPWHLQALAAACRQRGVRLIENAEVTGFRFDGDRTEAVQTTGGELTAEAFAITSGAWSCLLLNQLGIANGILPVRGQMVLYRCERPPLRHIVNSGPRYLVPREDGRLLVGSTEEEVGFDKRTTAEAIAELKRLATTLVPELANAKVEATWAGLRPGSFDGFPYLGRVPRTSNLYIASGHYRSGLFLSPGTAVVMSAVIRQAAPPIDLSPFRIGRG